VASAPVRSSNGCRVVAAALALAAALPRVAGGADALDAELRALVADQRPAGGWTFASAPGTRPEPFTLIVRTAERWLSPLGLATWDLVVMRSPGTPAAGLVLLEGWRRSRRPAYLEAARRAGDLVVATQLAPGGWFSEIPVHGTTAPWWFRIAAGLRPMLDDDITPGAARLLVELSRTSGDPRHRAAAERAIALMREAELPSGGWPLDVRPAWLRRVRPHHEDQPALNDGATPFVITTLIAAAPALDRPELLAAARRGGDWLLTVQAPGAGWAQQYTANGAPARARVFEPPALATWETRYAVDALVALARVTGEARYCESARVAARWLDRVRVGPACWARFHDLATGRPIFVDPAGRRVQSSAEARPGYSWMGEFGIPWTLAGLGIAGGAPMRRLPGDPGHCAEDPRPPRPLGGARARAAAAATMLGEREGVPPPPEVCALLP
jgi:hypothetical protein